jgi:hypothetical protein
MTGKADWKLLIEGGRIYGVYSSSTAETIKRARFPRRYAEFANARTYAEWQFFYVPPGRGIPGTNPGRRRQRRTRAVGKGGAGQREQDLSIRAIAAGRLRVSKTGVFDGLPYRISRVLPHAKLFVALSRMEASGDGCPGHRPFARIVRLRAQTAGGTGPGPRLPPGRRPYVEFRILRSAFTALLLTNIALPALAQSFRVQCPDSTTLHPAPAQGGGVAAGIKCQQISGGDGYATMGDGTDLPVLVRATVGAGRYQERPARTQPNSVFNTVGSPQTDPTYNGAVGLVPDPEATDANHPDRSRRSKKIADVGVMNGNMAPTMAIDEDDEVLPHVDERRDDHAPRSEQHTVHFHGYPNASSFYDGRAGRRSRSISAEASRTTLAPDAGTYFWHCHITPPEHLQMGMVGQIYVRPRQNRVPMDGTTTLYAALMSQQADRAPAVARTFSAPRRCHRRTHSSVCRTRAERPPSMPTTMATDPPPMTLSTRSRSTAST